MFKILGLRRKDAFAEEHQRRDVRRLRAVRPRRLHPIRHHQQERKVRLQSYTKQMRTMSVLVLLLLFI